MRAPKILIRIWWTKRSSLLIAFGAPRRRRKWPQRQLLIVLHCLSPRSAPLIVLHQKAFVIHFWSIYIRRRYISFSVHISLGFSGKFGGFQWQRVGDTSRRSIKNHKKIESNIARSSIGPESQVECFRWKISETLTFIFNFCVGRPPGGWPSPALSDR